MSDLDHLRAKDANERLEERFPAPPQGIPVSETSEAKQQRMKPLKDYRSVALNAGAYLRQCGLLQTAAFWGSKKQEDATRQVLSDVVAWLCRSDLTNWICKAGPANSQRAAISTASPMRALLQRNADEIAILEEEAQNYLLWLKRLTEGLYKDRDGE